MTIHAAPSAALSSPLANPYRNASVLLPEPWRASTPRLQARLRQRHNVLGVGSVAGQGERVRISWCVWGRSPTYRHQRQVGDLSHVGVGVAASRIPRRRRRLES